MLKKLATLLILILLASLAYAYPKTLIGKCTAVIDGDTIEVLSDRKLYRIRLAHIDCPEKRQPFGKKAKQFTSKLCFGRKVRVKVVDRDRYGRLVGVVYVGWTNVNKSLVRNGLAWWYQKYSEDESYGRLEERARRKKVGIWSVKRPVAPWEFRRFKKYR